MSLRDEEIEALTEKIDKLENDLDELGCEYDDLIEAAKDYIDDCVECDNVNGHSKTALEAIISEYEGR